MRRGFIGGCGGKIGVHGSDPRLRLGLRLRLGRTMFRGAMGFACLYKNKGGEAGLFTIGTWRFSVKNLCECRRIGTS
jgi:hypothetical protein